MTALAAAVLARRVWYAAVGVTHAHCPDDCEHPQPFLLNGTMYCGRCWFVYKQLNPMIPCRPSACAEKQTPAASGKQD